MSTSEAQDPSLATATSTGIQLARDANVLINNFLPPQVQSPLRPPHGLHLPLCIPQISPEFGAPFARGYNESLEEMVEISQSQLLSFIDGLNLAIVASPPLRIVDFAGKMIGMVYVFLPCCAFEIFLTQSTDPIIGL